jgi:ribosomal-protein-alanine N-acetyltransferase
MENVQIRRMAAADLARVNEIDASLSDAPHWPQSAYANALNPDSTPRRIALVAADPESGAVHGFTVASLLPPQAELETIAVAAASQRSGLGRRLFQELISQLLTDGAHTVVLEARASNRTARGFYRSLGFGLTGLRPRYYTDPVEDAVLMSLPLA